MILIATLTGPEIAPLFITMTGRFPPAGTLLEIGENGAGVFVSVYAPTVSITIETRDDGSLLYLRTLNASCFQTIIEIGSDGEGDITLIRRNPQDGETLENVEMAADQSAIDQIRALSRASLSFASPYVADVRKRAFRPKTGVI